ncbi:hypothetical protein SD15574_1180 [Shigella dysenteriae 155-74]|uniref:Uncharacterized protein n=2 Tax=Shigella boydii TaxID=621 RepID=I6EPC6_SHIBO|nr:hypothetical protein Sd1012_1858 [Shigella dysenteriae 1012]EGJ01257.1 hypothetical protein SD15574_1180 [Shigella dysenteriae 155-74]EIQ45868.1 hypothetical protein SB444474_0719 [Shigella boydii 4444-74]
MLCSVLSALMWIIFFTSWRKIIFLIASIVIYLVNPVYSGDKYGKSSDMGKNSSHRF